MITELKRSQGPEWAGRVTEEKYGRFMIYIHKKVKVDREICFCA
jgi:hypothetical protein